MSVIGWSLLLATLVVVAFYISVLLSHIELKLVVSKQGKYERIWVGVRIAYGIVRWRYEVRSIQFQNFNDGFSINSKQKEQSWAMKNKQRMRNFVNKELIMKWKDEFLDIVKHTHGFKKWAKQTLRHVEISTYIWDTEYGTSNAAHTGVLYGLIWAVTGGLTGYLTQLMSFKAMPFVEVIPQFGKPVFSTRVVCITRIRVVHAIFAVIVLIYRIRRSEGGVKQWRSIQSKA